jgi:hypothetical protein
VAQNLSISATLQGTITNIRRKTGLLDPQASGLTDVQLTDLIHTGLLAVRNDPNIKETIDMYYQRSDSVTFSAISAGIATVSITALNLSSISNPRLRATLTSVTNKLIPIFPRDRYDVELQTQTTTTLTTTGAVGTIYLTSASPNILTLEIFTGASTIGSAIFSYLKNPIKVTAVADTLDIPDQYTPFVEDYVVNILTKMPQVKPVKA